MNILGKKRWLTSLLIVPVCLLFMGQDSCDNTSERAKQSAKRIETTESLMKKQPSPQIDFSMDRYVLSERYKRFNDPNKMTYLYVVLPDGSWLQATIIGKLSSTSKRLTPPDYYDYYSSSYYTRQAPDEMGTWGSSEPAKVGMTTLGSLLEIGGFMAYLYSETPLTFKNFNKPMIEMVVQVSDQEKAELLKQLEEVQRMHKQ